MSLPPSNLPPVLLAGGPSARLDRRREKRLQYVTDAGIALLLLLTLGIVFLSDRHSPAADALYAHSASSERFLFDPLRAPIAEVRENEQRSEWIGAYRGYAGVGIGRPPRPRLAGPAPVRRRPLGARCTPGSACRSLQAGRCLPRRGRSTAWP